MAKIEQIKLKDVIYTIGASAEDISGTVPIDKGGTGETSANSAIRTLLSALNPPTDPGVITDEMTFATSRVDGENIFWYRRKISYLWNYIKSKADSIYSLATHKHSVDDITGTMPVNKGGTGRNSFTKNAILVGNDASGINTVTKLSVSQGGTGLTTITADAALIGNGTGNIKTRAITNNTSTSTSIAGSTNLATMNTLKNALNRTTSVAAADDHLEDIMARGIKAGSVDIGSGVTLPTGTIYLVYEET